MIEKGVRYVVGFLFDEALHNVVLIRKNKPDWQAGKLNGVGGKIELTDISPVAAMVREFKEETGLQTVPEGWHVYVELGDAHATWEVTFFWATAPSLGLGTVATLTDEAIVVTPVSVALSSTANIMANLSWLIPMALNHMHGRDRCNFHQIFEASYQGP